MNLSMRYFAVFLLVCTALLLLFLSIENTTAEKQPVWGHETGTDIRCVDISDDGEYIAAGGANGRVYLFHRDNSTPLWNYKTGDKVDAVAISANGTYIAAGSDDNYIYLFHKDSSTPLWQKKTGYKVKAVAISPDGEYIVAGNWDCKVFLFHRDSSTPIWKYETEDDVRSVAISADSMYIAVGYGAGIAQKDYGLYLFSRDNNEPLWTYETEDDIDSVAISANGTYIVAGDEDYNVSFFHKGSNIPLWTFTAGFNIASVAISADGRYIVAGSEDNHVYFFQRNSSTPLWKHEAGGSFLTVDISSTGEHIIAGSGDQNVYFFHKSGNIPVWTNSDNDDILNSVSITPDGQYMAAAGREGGIYYFCNEKPTGVIDEITPSPALDTDTVHFRGSGAIDNGSIASYSWRSSIDGVFYDGESPEFDYSDLSLGEHTIYFKVRSDEGFWSDEVNTTLVVHRKPTAHIDGITPDPAMDTDNIHFAGNGSDDGSITRYAWRSSMDDEFYNGTDAEFDNAGLSAGEHTIFLKVMDDYDVWSDEVNTTLTIYVNTPPTLSVTSPANHSTVSGTVTVSGGASDDDGNDTIENVRVSVDGGGWQNATGTTSWNFEWDTIAMENGEHTLKFRAFDGTDFSGVEEIVLNVQNTAENIIPTISIISPADNDKVSGTVTISGSASDADGTVVRIDISINNENWIMVTGTTSWNYQWNTKFVPDGNCEVRVRAYDGEDYSDIATLNLNVENGGGGDDDDDDSPGLGAALLLVSAALVGCAPFLRRR